MEFFHFFLFSCLSVAFVASHAAISPADYWKSVLPNTPMPNAITELLHPEVFEDKVNTKGTYVVVGNGGVGVGVSTRKLDGSGTHKTNDKIRYNSAATADQLQDSPSVALYFLEKDMKKGTKMNLHFTKTVNSATFLPREVSEKIPFSSKSLPAILNQFSVKPESAEAETIKKTVQECEEPSNKGEEKYCATSLESMVDFTTSKLGKKVNAVSTEVEKVTQPQKYSIQGVKKIGNDKAVVCHKQSYVYGVFYCHKIQTTRTYLVALAGGDGTKAKAVAVCHTNTAGWNPKHLAFQLLKVKPGSVPICHFLPEDNVVWVPY